MFIHEVEHIVHLSKKSIRYYEEIGLLNPKRSKENDYRIYDEEDIRTLKTIKFLRELDVPIRTLKLLKDKTLSLKECLLERIDKITLEQEKYEIVKCMCLKILEDDVEFEDFNEKEYFEKMNTLNKTGFTLRTPTRSHKRKIFEAFCSFFFFFLISCALFLLASFLKFIQKEPIPWIIYGFLGLLFLLFSYGLIKNFYQRVQEILGGEEDEASKY